MGKSIGSRKNINRSYQGTTKYFRKRLNLLRHLSQSKLQIDKSLADEVVDEDTRGIRQIVDDLQPDVIPEPIYKTFFNDRSKSRSESRLGSKSTVDDSENFLYRKTTKFGKKFRNTKRITTDYTIPPVSQLEESGLSEFYNSFSSKTSWQISNLNVKPGDKHFLFWFLCSSYIPLLCSCSGPLSNVFSIMAIICPWKINKINPKYEKDPIWCYSINTVSSALAIVSNTFLFLNYRKKIRYTKGQVISIYGWGIACVLLTALIIGYHIWFYRSGHNENYIIGEGFWFAIITICLHFTNFFLLLVNEIGFLMKKYKPVFNIDNTQETLIVQTLALSGWLVIGAGVFTAVLDLRLGPSFFYCINSIVTIGDQGVVSTTNPLGQTLTSIWIVCGLVIFGLIINSIRNMMFNFSDSTLYWHRIERLRKRFYKSHKEDKKIKLDNAGSFKLIKNIHKWAFTIQGISELAVSIFIFMVTLMCGALTFALLEDWSYKLSVYYCFFNLMTLGQGSQNPVTPGGKTFFCIWALAAIPVMTILVSTASDFVFYKITNISEFKTFEVLVEFCLSNKYLKDFGYFLQRNEVISIDKDRISKLRMKSMITVDNDVQSDNSLETTEKSKSHGNFDGMNHVSRHAEFAGSVFDHESNSNYFDIDPVGGIPVASHPVDMLYTVLLDIDSLGNYGFVHSKQFVRSNTAAVQLANYFREGKRVKIDPEQQEKSREVLIENFKSLDENFDVNKFEEIYKLNGLGEDSDSLGVGAISEDNIVETKFKKKNDYVLDKLSRIQVIMLELRKTLLDLCLDKNHKYNYIEWQNMMRLTCQNNAIDDELFWLEKKSPLSVPLHQPKYFTLHYLRYFELYIQKFAEEWDGIPVTYPAKHSDR